MSVAVVTDSTAYLPATVADGSLTVVPLHVVLGGVSGREGVEGGRAALEQLLPRRRVAPEGGPREEQGPPAVEPLDVERRHLPARAAEEHHRAARAQ